MKIKDEFILKKLTGTNVVVPAVGVVDMSFIVTLNETACFLWEKLSQETRMEDLITALLAEYEVDRETAKKEIEKFLKKMEEKGFLE